MIKKRDDDLFGESNSRRQSIFSDVSDGLSIHNLIENKTKIKIRSNPKRGKKSVDKELSKITQIEKKSKRNPLSNQGLTNFLANEDIEL